MRIEKIVLNEERNVSLTAYLQDVGGEFGFQDRPAVMVMPGGAYLFCSDREADPVAAAFLRGGYHSFVLRYSVGENRTWPNPLCDYDQAYAYIADHAGDWGVDMNRLAVAGFSAGGHLAGAAATLARHRPAAAILGYAVVTDQVREVCDASDMPDVTTCVDHKTPPCFIFSSRSDPTVKISNSLRMMEALDAAGITFESHIYAGGPHGFSTGEYWLHTRSDKFCDRIPHWVDDALGFLADVMGENRPFAGKIEPRYGRHINGDWDAYLSADCTVKRILGNPRAVEAIKPLLERIRREMESFVPMMAPEDMLRAVEGMTLAELLAERQIRYREEEVRGLQAIPNDRAGDLSDGSDR